MLVTGWSGKALGLKK